MKHSSTPLEPGGNPAKGLYLGIEGGGTKTIALAVDEIGRVRHRIEAGVGNIRLLTDAQLIALLKNIAHRIEEPLSIAIGMAGAREEKDKKRIRQAVGEIWPGASCTATNDLETGLAAVDLEGEDPEARILIIGGTGSCCYGQSRSGNIAKIGGWGHVLGDQGSGYAIGMSALRSVVASLDATGKLPDLGRRFLRRLLLNEPNDLIQWAQHAGKDDVASLSAEVFESSRLGDRLSRQLITKAAGQLAADAIACADKLASRRQPVAFILSGGVLTNQPPYARALSRCIKQCRPKAVIRVLKGESVQGAVRLAFAAVGKMPACGQATAMSPSISPVQPVNLVLSPTEQRNARSMKLDTMPIREAVELMLSEDETLPDAIRSQSEPIIETIDLTARQLKRGGRLFYVGAGTSGRLGVLDASECPPTFRTNPEQIQGIIAGGQRALWQAVEGAEDDRDAGARAMVFRNVGKQDVVVGIAASGRTPFVLGALSEAKKLSAHTVLLAFNPHVSLNPCDSPDILIAVNAGPEVLTGSTRLKAGTATKMILNMITTIAMVRLGKVIGNLMVDLNPSNVKLRDRAVRIVSELTGVSREQARTELENQKWQVAQACRKLGMRCDSEKRG